MGKLERAIDLLRATVSESYPGGWPALKHEIEEFLGDESPIVIKQGPQAPVVTLVLPPGGEDGDVLTKNADGSWGWRPLPK